MVSLRYPRYETVTFSFKQFEETLQKLWSLICFALKETFQGVHQTLVVVYVL